MWACLVCSRHRKRWCPTWASKQLENSREWDGRMGLGKLGTCGAPRGPRLATAGPGPGPCGAQRSGADLAGGRWPPPSRPGAADPPAGQWWALGLAARAGQEAGERVCRRQGRGPRAREVVARPAGCWLRAPAGPVARGEFFWFVSEVRGHWSLSKGGTS